MGFQGFQLLKEASEWAGTEHWAVWAVLPPLTGMWCMRTSDKSLTRVHNREIATSSLCFSVMLTYSGSSGHTPKKPLMTLQLCNLNSLCSCSDCQEYCNPKSLLCNWERETWAAADRHILTIRFLSRLAFRLIFYVNRTMVFPYRLLQYSKAVYFSRKLSTML